MCPRVWPGPEISLRIRVAVCPVPPPCGPAMQSGTHDWVAPCPRDLSPQIAGAGSTDPRTSSCCTWAEAPDWAPAGLPAPSDAQPRTRHRTGVPRPPRMRGAADRPHAGVVPGAATAPTPSGAPGGGDRFAQDPGGPYAAAGWAEPWALVDRWARLPWFDRIRHRRPVKSTHEFGGGVLRSRPEGAGSTLTHPTRCWCRGLRDKAGRVPSSHCRRWCWPAGHLRTG